ncbi:MAG: response regulator transcription factor [Vicinamibacterales bacterium]
MWIDGDFRATIAAAEDLIRYGVHVDTAAVASTGIALAAQNTYSLVLLDGHLPDLPATDVLKALKNLRIKAPVVIITIPVGIETAVAWMRLGAIDIALKPISALDLLSILRQYLHHKSPYDQGSPIEPPVRREVISQITRTLLSRPTTPLAQAARAVGLERHVVERYIRSETGRSYREWRREVVIHGAAEVLRSSTLPIKAVAYELGYRSVRAFARAFRSVLGVSPSSYRQHLGSLSTDTKEISATTAGVCHK